MAAARSVIKLALVAMDSVPSTSSVLHAIPCPGSPAVDVAPPPRDAPRAPARAPVGCAVRAAGSGIGSDSGQSESAQLQPGDAVRAGRSTRYPGGAQFVGYQADG